MDTSVMITLGFLVFAIVMFAWEKIPLSITAMIVAVGLHLSGVLSAKDAFAGFVDPNVLLFMGMFVIGAAFFETGVAVEVGNVVHKFAKTETSLLVAVMMITGILSGFLSNTGTAAVLIPVIIGICKKAVLAAIVIASSLAYATPIGMPANTMVYNIAGYSFMDYVKAGLPLIVVSSIVALVLLPILFPF